jgi:phosphate starvation-inducible PhoH-like protein
MDKINLLTPRNERQKDFQHSLHDNIVTIASGYSGVGKTLIALNYGLAGLAAKNYEKIIYIRPDVSVDYQRGRGALPGEKFEKSLPLLAPLLDNLNFFCQEGLKKYLLEKELIEYVYLEDVRGRSFSNSEFVIFDEAQNSSIEQFKTILTRIGIGSTLAILGDPSQVDVNVLKYTNGLQDAIHRLNGLKNLGIVEFKMEDIVRSPILKHILKRYETPSKEAEESYAKDMAKYIYNS